MWASILKFLADLFDIINRESVKQDGKNEVLLQQRDKETQVRKDAEKIEVNNAKLSDAELDDKLFGHNED